MKYIYIYIFILNSTARTLLKKSLLKKTRLSSETLFLAILPDSGAEIRFLHVLPKHAPCPKPGIFLAKLQGKRQCAWFGPRIHCACEMLRNQTRL